MSLQGTKHTLKLAIIYRIKFCVRFGELGEEDAVLAGSPHLAATQSLPTTTLPSLSNSEVIGIFFLFAAGGNNVNLKREMTKHRQQISSPKPRGERPKDTSTAKEKEEAEKIGGVANGGHSRLEF